MHEGLPNFTMPGDDQARAAADALRILADPTRLKLMWALLQGEENVACLADLTGARPTAVSQHLAKLRLAGLVTTRREGTFVYYVAADDRVKPLLEQVLALGD
ncbi:metalloregulator ArsR/SmtB family transcription factor [Glycomyces sp. NPDC047010]|uniref:ArsR/SmtB family transcription factor n=1 Tax=Glycomyces sp. NPDC047010 TaxID=3155023 RepID=UPI0033C6ACBE